MRTDLPQAVLDAADMIAVTQLLLVERESRDLGRWEQMRDCFHPDSRVRVSWFTGTGADFVTGSIDMGRRVLLGLVVVVALSLAATALVEQGATTTLT